MPDKIDLNTFYISEKLKRFFLSFKNIPTKIEKCHNKKAKK